MSSRRQELYELTLAFLDAFNRNDLDAVMAFFSDDIVYDELDGTASRGLEAVREAFRPQFEGRFGRMEFVEDETFIDPESGQVMSSWTLYIDKDDGRLALRGLDLLTFTGNKISYKHTYVKAKSALYESAR